VREIPDPDALADLIGEELGVSDWLHVEQDRIDAFAEATGDHQWLHVDPERARSGPYGKTIAHGYLTLSLLPVLTASAFRVGSVRARVNYGLERVRFPAVVRSDARVRNRATLQSVEPVPGGVRMVVRNVVEVDGGTRPVCIADTVTLLLTEAGG